MRILIIKLSSLGDVFHALPTVHMLKAATGASVDWCVNTSYASLVACFPDVDRVIPFPRNSLAKDIQPFLRELRSEAYDWVIDLQGLLKSALVARAARSNLRIGPSFHREGSRLLYHRVVGPRRLERHAVEQLLDVVDALELPRTDDIQFPVTFPTDAGTSPAPRHPNIAIAPISRWPSKNWPVARFAEVARTLQAETGATITLLGGPGQTELDACRTIAQALHGPCRNLCGKTSLPEMGAELAAADVLIANDSGPVHMAAALGTPTVVLFGPTDPIRIGPYGHNHHILQAPEPCRCRRRKVCAHPDNPCIASIPVASVVQATLAALPPT